MHCKYCNKKAVYKCRACGNLLCTKHAKLGTICSFHTSETDLKYTICRITNDRERIAVRNAVQSFWGEEEQLTFDKRYVVAELPAYAAKAASKLIGFVSYTVSSQSLIIVALGVLPPYQDKGIGKELIEKVEGEAKRSGKNEILVSTSNDDLPGLAFYQSLGFRIIEVKIGVIAEKHMQVSEGIGGLQIRDEVRLRKKLN